MDCTLTQTALATALTTVKHGAHTAKTRLPILGAVLLEAVEDKLVLSTTNLTVYYTLEVEADVRVDGQIAVPVDTLSRLVKLVGKGDSVRLLAVGGKLAVSVVGKQKNWQLAGLQDFPSKPDTYLEHFVGVHGDALAGAVASVAFAAGPYEFARPALAGVNICQTGGSLQIACGDGSRLATTSVDVQMACCFDQEVTLPAKELATALKLLSGDVVLGYTEGGRAYLLGEALSIAIHPIDEAYPVFFKVRDAVYSTHATLSLSELAQAVKQAKVVPDAFYVTVTLERGLVAFETASDEMTVRHEADATCGGKAEVLLSIKHLKDFLNEAKGETVTLLCSGPADPVMLQASGSAAYAIAPYTVTKAEPVAA